MTDITISLSPTARCYLRAMCQRDRDFLASYPPSLGLVASYDSLLAIEQLHETHLPHR